MLQKFYKKKEIVLFFEYQHTQGRLTFASDKVVKNIKYVRLSAVRQ